MILLALICIGGAGRQVERKLTITEMHNIVCPVNIRLSLQVQFVFTIDTENKNKKRRKRTMTTIVTAAPTTKTAALIICVIFSCIVL